VIREKGSFIKENGNSLFARDLRGYGERTRVRDSLWGFKQESPGIKGKKKPVHGWKKTAGCVKGKGSQLLLNKRKKLWSY